MNIQVNDLAPMNGAALDNVSAAVALLDSIDNANEIISRLMLHTCSTTVQSCSSLGSLDTLLAELITIERTARHLVQHV